MTATTTFTPLGPAVAPVPCPTCGVCPTCGAKTTIVIDTSPPPYNIFYWASGTTPVHDNGIAVVG